MSILVPYESPECSHYKKFANKQCPEAEYHHFLKGKTKAMSKCDSDPNCFAIYDPGCSGQNLLICQNEDRWNKHQRVKSLDSCIYKKASK